MFDFNKIHTEQINSDFVLSKISDASIFYHYFGEFSLTGRYPSKFRKDRNPSTGFYISKKGRITYNDFTNSEKMDCFAFVAKLHNISYGEAVRKIAAEWG